MQNIIDKITKKYSANTFLINNSEKISYKNILKRTEKKLKFIKPGDLILIIADNDIYFFEIYFYALKHNIPQILIDKNTSGENLKKIIKLYKPNYLFLRKDNLKEFKTLDKINFYNYFVLNFSRKKIKINKDLAVLLSTSGSTGSSKFVKLSHENILDNANNIAKYLKIDKSQTTITTMVPSYSYGLSIINSHFVKGARIVVNDNNFFNKEFWNKLNTYKVSSFGGVPFHYQIIKKLKFDKLNLVHLKYLTQAGGALDKEELTYFIKNCEKNKIKFIQMYGQTEASPRMTYLPFSKAKEKIGSIGKPIPGGRMYLKKGKTKKIGEIIYQGKNVFIGYSLSHKDLNIKKNFKELETGDLAWRDNEGFYYITGRKNRYIKIAGLRVNLDEIKQFLKDQKIDAELIENENKILIFTNSDIKKDKMLNTLFIKLRLNKSFFKIIKIKSFPKNIRDKVDYKKLIKNELY